MTTQLIAFAGRKYSGKDTAAAALADLGFVNVKMAGALKAMLTALLQYVGLPDEMIDRMLEGDLKETPSPWLSDRTPRHAMQQLGTAWGRDTMAKDFWVQVAAQRVGLFDKVVISDIRFPNEVDFVRIKGGKIYRIERPNGADLVDFHPSEAAIDGLDVDGVIRNDWPTAEAFAQAVRHLHCVKPPVTAPVWHTFEPGECPVDPETWVFVQTRGGQIESGHANLFFWGHLGSPLDVVAWHG
jgi:rhodanese-related sulfurtransferase